MPIKGLSDKHRMPRVGKIRLGIKKPNQSGFEYPQAIDFFLVKADDSTPADMAAAFHKVYDEKPRELDILFPVNNREEFFPQWLKKYGKSGLLCRGDGETAGRVDTNTGEIEEIDCDPLECDAYAQKQCRRVGALQFILPRLPGVGCWQISTSSYNSIVNLNSNIDFITTLTRGVIAMLPLKLVLRPQSVLVDGKKLVIHVMNLTAPDVYIGQLINRARALNAGPTLAVEMPPIDETRPDDLYPDGVAEAAEEGHQVAEAESAPTVAQPAQATQPAQPAQPAQAAQPAPQLQPQPAADPLDKKIDEALDILSWTDTRRKYWRKQHANKADSLKGLQAEIDRMNSDDRTKPTAAGKPAAPAQPKAAEPEKPAAVAPTQPEKPAEPAQPAESLKPTGTNGAAPRKRQGVIF